MQKLTKYHDRFVRGVSSQSCNEFVGSRSGVKFINPRETLVLCRDSLFMSASQSALQINVKLLYIMSNLWSTNENAHTLPITIQPHKPHKINYENTLINLYKLLVHYEMFSLIPTGECVAKPHMYFTNFFTLYHRWYSICKIYLFTYWILLLPINQLLPIIYDQLTSDKIFTGAQQ